MRGKVAKALRRQARQAAAEAVEARLPVGVQGEGRVRAVAALARALYRRIKRQGVGR